MCLRVEVLLMLVVCHISAAVAAADQMQGGWVGGAGAASHRSLPHDNTLTFACGRTVTPGNWSSITCLLNPTDAADE